MANHTKACARCASWSNGHHLCHRCARQTPAGIERRRRARRKWKQRQAVMSALARMDGTTNG